MAVQGLGMRTVTAALVDRLRQDILSGDYPPGAQLRQDAIAASAGVSRIPVREALLQLEAEGLVEIAPHRGAVVTALSVEEVDDVLALRALLEPRLLSRSIPHLVAEDFRALESIQGEFVEAIAKADRGRWGALNARLHLVLYAKAGLPRSLAIVSGLLQTSERYTRIQLASEAACERAQAEHEELIALSRARKTREAVALLRRHIATVRTELDAMIRAGVPKG